MHVAPLNIFIGIFGCVPTSPLPLITNVNNFYIFFILIVSYTIHIVMNKVSVAQSMVAEWLKNKRINTNKWVRE